VPSGQVLPRWWNSIMDGSAWREHPAGLAHAGDSVVGFALEARCLRKDQRALAFFMMSVFTVSVTSSNIFPAAAMSASLTRAV